MTEPQDDFDELFAKNMSIVSDAQAEWRNPVTQVALRAGFIIGREVMARFVEQGGDVKTAASIRASWLPQLGDDPGTPRLYHFDEMVETPCEEDGRFVAKEISAAREGACYAYVAMHSFGLFAESAKA